MKTQNFSECRLRLNLVIYKYSIYDLSIYLLFAFAPNPRHNLSDPPPHPHTHLHTRIIEGRNQIMLELRLIFYSILMRQTKADKQTPTPTPTAESTLILAHTSPPIPRSPLQLPAPSSFGPWAHGPMAMAMVWFVVLYTQLQGASNQSQTRGHGLCCSSPALMLGIAGWGEIIATMGHGGVPVD